MKTSLTTLVVSACSLAITNAALDFDALNGVTDNPLRGYQTESVTNGVNPGVDNSWDSATPSGNGLSTFGIDGSGTVSFVGDDDETGLQTDFATFTLDITHDEPLGGPINELRIFGDLAIATPGQVSLTVTWRGVSQDWATIGGARFKDWGIAENDPNAVLTFGETETLTFTFSGVSRFDPNLNGPGMGGFTGNDWSATLSNLSITAVVPEPSSALLLSGVLGLFGTTFRRRRKLTVTT